MCFRSHHSHLHDGDSSHHHHGEHDGGATATAGAGHCSGPGGWAAAHSALWGHGGTALPPIDLGASQAVPADPHAAGLLDAGHGLTAVIAGNVNNGGIQINVIEVEYTAASHVVQAH